MVTKQEKSALAEKFGGAANNTGAAAVQIAILTKQIELLSKHFAGNKKDLHSRRGFIAKIERRKSLLAYLRTTNYETYQSLISELGIRK